MAGRPKRKLPPDEEIYETYIKERTLQRAAEVYHVSRRTISSIAHRYLHKQAMRAEIAKRKNRTVVNDDHCRGCEYAQYVGQTEEGKGKSRKVIFCPFGRCVKHFGFIIDKKVGRDESAVRNRHL
jgi:hypothetical protein